MDRKRERESEPERPRESKQTQGSKYSLFKRHVISTNIFKLFLSVLLQDKYFCILYFLYLMKINKKINMFIVIAQMLNNVFKMHKSIKYSNL